MSPDMPGWSALVGDLCPGDILVDYGGLIEEIELITDPHPETQHARIRLTDGRTLWLASLDDVTVCSEPRPRPHRRSR